MTSIGPEDLVNDNSQEALFQCDHLDPTTHEPRDNSGHFNQKHCNQRRKLGRNPITSCASCFKEFEKIAQNQCAESSQDHNDNCLNQ